LQRLINKSLPTWLFLFCLLVFARGLGGDFVMDDWPVVKENSRITETKYIADYFTRGVWANTDFAAQTGAEDHSLYRPLFLLTLNVAYQLWGDNAFGYHALNLLLHGINTVLLYFLILGFLPGASRMIAGMSAAIFAAHPLHAESVAWIAGITDPLVSVFLFSAFLLHRRASQQANANTTLLANIGAPLCFALALLSKETAIFFPLIVLTFDIIFHLDKMRSKSALGRYAGYALLLVAYFILRSNALGGDTNQPSVWARIELQNLPVLFEFFTHYIQLLFFPWPLDYYYQPPATGVFTLIFGGLIFIAALAYFPRAAGQKKALFVMAVSWSLFTLLPALPVALFAEPVFVPRALYLPTAGIAMFIAYLLQLTQHSTKAIAAGMKTVAVLTLIVFSMSAMTEIQDWENDTRFYTQAMKSNPGSYRPVAGLAAAYSREKNIEPAIDLYLKAAKLAHRDSAQLDYMENAASLYGQSGETAKSEELYRRITQRAPRRSSAWVGMGNNALARGDQQQALAFYQQAYQADPSNFVASYNLMLTYQRLGQLQQAAHFRDISRKLQQANQ
jgi:tetratricopeptide (TPR) repeat protein